MLLTVSVYGFVYLLCLLVCAKATSRSLRQFVLLAGSYSLYAMWGAWFALVLLGSTVVNFLVGSWLRRKPEAPILALGIVLNLLLLGSFKYLPEAAIALPFSSLQRFSHLVLPLGLSFWTFQAMSYLFDQYRGDDLDPTFLEFALYMVFFPCVISGPICRMPDMLPQFREKSQISWENLGNGFCRVAMGVLMVQVARLLGQGILGGDGVTSGFDHASQWSAGDVCFLAVGFGLQLFFDFAGYTHIVLGVAKSLGITMPENFDRPFLSTTPSVFWTRWHMSLSFWIRDYLFLPMAMMRREMWWRNFVLFASMVVFGLWHKGTLLFLLWGAYHGTLLVLHRLVQTLERKWSIDTSAPIWEPISWITTMALINLGWIFFRANSLSQAGQMFSSLASPFSQQAGTLSSSFYWLVVVLAAGYLCALLVGEKLTASPEGTGQSSVLAAAARHRWYWLPALYLTVWLIFVVIGAGPGTSTAEFMYRGF